MKFVHMKLITLVICGSMMVATEAGQAPGGPRIGQSSLSEQLNTLWQTIYDALRVRPQAQAELEQQNRIQNQQPHENFYEQMVREHPDILHTPRSSVYLLPKR